VLYKDIWRRYMKAIRIRNRGIRSFLVLVFILAFSVMAFSADLLMKDNEFREADEVWDFIPDYTDMADGDAVNWVWTKPGVHLYDYKTVEVPKFENISKTVDIYAQDLLTDNMKDGIQRLGPEVVESKGEITINGAMVDYWSGSGAVNFFAGFGAGQPLVEVEVYVVDNKTGEIISKVRHQAHDATIESAIAEVISDIINYWAAR
jgi:hypothetical protein